LSDEIAHARQLDAPNAKRQMPTVGERKTSNDLSCFTAKIVEKTERRQLARHAERLLLAAIVFSDSVLALAARPRVLSPRKTIFLFALRIVAKRSHV